MQSDGTGLGPGGGGQPAAIVIQSGRARAAKPEEIYRAWLELAEPRISAEQTLLSGFTLGATEPAPGVRAVLAFFDGLAAQVFTRQTDVGELSNYMAADARRWRNLLRAFRQRSAAARDTDRYHQLTRALAATEFLASEPITDAERTSFVLEKHPHGTHRRRPQDHHHRRHQKHPPPPAWARQTSRSACAMRMGMFAERR